MLISQLELTNYKSFATTGALKFDKGFNVITGQNSVGKTGLFEYTSWKEYHDNFKNNVGPGFSSLTITPNNDVKIKRSGTLALTTLTFHLSANQKDGTALEFDGRHTIVWEKRGAKWLIIHEHVSKPLF